MFLPAFMRLRIFRLSSGRRKLTEAVSTQSSLLAPQESRCRWCITSARRTVSTILLEARRAACQLDFRGTLMDGSFASLACARADAQIVLRSGLHDEQTNFTVRCGISCRGPVETQITVCLENGLDRIEQGGMCLTCDASWCISHAGSLGVEATSAGRWALHRELRHLLDFCNAN